MTVCTRCSDSIDDGTLLSGSEVYGELASGTDREELLDTYSGIRYGRETVLCATCLDAPADCPECDGAGEVPAEGGGTEPCSACDGAGTTRPDLLRNCCK
jgi:hypothetical protein